MEKSIVGYGSIFHKKDISYIAPVPGTSFLGEHELFYAGRFALKYLLNTISQFRELDRIWLPSYYCPYVKNWIEQEFKTIKYYDIDPFDAMAEIDWSPFCPLDVVIINNYWGIKETKIPKGERPLVIEDHSHGWLSKGCVESEADFCMASLRKTLPIPLGGIAWKPKHTMCAIPLKPLKKNGYEQDTNPMRVSWELMENAMTKKALCTHANEKTEYLISYSQGEMLLRNTQEIIPLSSDHERVIRDNLFRDLNAFKKDNLAWILTKLAPSRIFKVISTESSTPFGLLLAFKNWGMLSNFKQFLIANSIYPAELWPQNRIAQEYNFLLNIHIDFRYTTKDLEYMADTINQWSTIEVPEDFKVNL